MEYTIVTLDNGHRFARLPDGRLVPNQGRFLPYVIATDEDIAANFADFKERFQWNTPTTN